MFDHVRPHRHTHKLTIHIGHTFNVESQCRAKQSVSPSSIAILFFRFSALNDGEDKFEELVTTFRVFFFFFFVRSILPESPM